MAFREIKSQQSEDPSEGGRGEAAELGDVCDGCNDYTPDLTR